MIKKATIAILLAFLLPLSTSAHLVTDQFFLEIQEKEAAPSVSESLILDSHASLDHRSMSFDHDDATPDCCGAVCLGVSTVNALSCMSLNPDILPFSNPGNPFGLRSPLLRPPIT